MRFVRCDVATVCIGQAASAAAVLLAAGAPGERLTTPGARVMIHQPSPGDVIQGQATDPAIQARELTRTRERLEDLLERHTGQDIERIRADIERDTFLDAEAALAYELVDEITPRRKTG